MERLWTKLFIFMVSGMFFLFFAFYLLYTTMPLFIKQIGGNEAQVGLAMGSFMLSAVIFRPLVGGLLDRFGRRPFMLLGLILFAVAMYMYNWVDGMVGLMTLRILHGVTWAFSTTAILTAITDLIPRTRRGEGMGWSGMSMTLAMAVGPMFGLWVIQDHSFHYLFLIAVGLSAIALILTFRVKLPFESKSDKRRIEIVEKSVLPVTITVFFLFLSYGGITTFVPLFADSIKVNSGTFFLVYAIAIVLIRPIAGRLSDRNGEKFVIVPSLVMTIVALIILSISTGLFGFLLSAVLYGIGFGSAQPAFQAAIIRLVSPERAGVANASFSTATDLGIGLGAIILGWVSQYTSYQVLFTVSAVSVLVSLLLFIYFLKGKELSSKSKDSLPSKTR